MPEPNTRSLSPTFVWRPGKIRGPRPPHGTAPEGDRPAFPPRRDNRKPLALDLAYVGGSEGRILIRARGWRWIFPASVTLAEVTQCLNGLPPRRFQ